MLKLTRCTSWWPLKCPTELRANVTSPGTGSLNQTADTGPRGPPRFLFHSAQPRRKTSQRAWLPMQSTALTMVASFKDHAWPKDPVQARSPCGLLRLRLESLRDQDKIRSIHASGQVHDSPHGVPQGHVRKGEVRGSSPLARCTMKRESGTTQTTRSSGDVREMAKPQLHAAEKRPMPSKSGSIGVSHRGSARLAMPRGSALRVHLALQPPSES